MIYLSPLKQSLINLPTHFLFVFMFVFNGIFIAKELSVIEWSTITMLFPLVLVVLTLSSIGFSHAFGLYLLNIKEKYEEVIGFGVILISIISLFFTLLILFIIGIIYFYNIGELYYKLLIYGLPFLYIINFHFFIFNINKYLGKIHYNSIVKGITHITLMISIFLLYYLSFLEPHILFIFYYLTIFPSTLIMFLLIYKIKFKNIRNHYNNFKLYIKQGRDIFLSEINIIISQNIDMIILGFTHISQTIILKIGTILFSPLLNFLNDFSEAKVKGFNNGEKITKDNIILFPIIVFIYGLFFYIFSNYLIEISFGKEYSYISQYTWFFILNGLIEGYNMLLYNNIHINKNLSNILKQKTFYRLIINILLSIILIPLYGLIGAFIAIILTNTYLLSEYYFLYKKKK